MIVTIGESVYDIIFKEGKPISSVYGGSMYNVAVSLGRAGLRVSYVGFYADDEIGHGSQLFLDENGVDTSYFKIINGARSNLALAFLDNNGIPSYTFYRDEKLTGKVVEIDFSKVDVLLVGSYFSINDQNFEMILSLINKAKEFNVLVAYDPNIRNHDIYSNSLLLNRVKKIMNEASFVKMSDEDAMHITGTDDLLDWHDLITSNGVGKYVLTRGEKPAIASFDGEDVYIDVVKTKIVSTVGAGDATTAGILSFGKDFVLDRKNFYNAVRRGVEFGSHVCTLHENFIQKGFKVK